MSDSLNIIIKLISSLTSPKACFKYFLICGSIFFSWKYLYDSQILQEVGEEHRKLLILLLSVSTGSLVVDSVVTAYEKIKNKIQKNHNEKVRLIKKKNEQDIFKVTFKETYNHLSDEQVITLERLLACNGTININSEQEKILLENQYVIYLQNVTSSEVVVALNPLIKDIVLENKNQMTQWLVEDFFTDKEDANNLLQIMENPSQKSNIKIRQKYLDEISEKPICIESEYSEKKDGYHLWFVRDRFKKYLESTSGKKYNNEIFIESSKTIKR